MFKSLVTVLLCARFINGSPIEVSSVTSKFTPRIIGGVDAPKAYAPHMVALISGGFFRFVSCGGSIISEKLILTAAHCIDPNVDDKGKLLPSFHGRVGSNQWNSSGIIIEFDGYKNHPQWDPHYIKYDTGVLFMNKKLNFNEKVSGISLGFDRVDTVEAYAAGWGSVGPRIEDNIVHLAPTPDDLQLLYVNTITHEQCSADMHAASLLWGTAPHINRDVEICTYHSIGHGMCNGDSGSALVTVKDQRQIGIVSWGFPCAVGAPDVFVRISGMKSFIIPLLESNI